MSKYNVYLEENEFDSTGRLDISHDAALETIGTFDTEEEAKRFIDNYDLEDRFKTAVDCQGYGSVEVVIYALEEDSNDQLFMKSMKSNPGDNARKIYYIILNDVDGDSGNPIVDDYGEDYEKAKKAYDNAVSVNAYEVRHNGAFKIDEEYGLGNTYKASVTLVEETQYGDDDTLTETEDLEGKIIGYLDDSYKNQPTKAYFCTEEDYTEGVREWADNVKEWRFQNDIEEDNVELPR